MKKTLDLSSPLRLLTLEDANLIASIHQQSLGSPWSQRSFEDLLSQPTSLGWIHPHHWGFILLQTPAMDWEILTVCVLPNKRNQGIGRMFVRRAVEEAHAQKATLFLEVNESNHPARCLYCQEGFQEIGRRAGYYLDRGEAQDALVMRCSPDMDKESLSS